MKLENHKMTEKEDPGWQEEIGKIGPIAEEIKEIEITGGEKKEMTIGVRTLMIETIGGETKATEGEIEENEMMSRKEEGMEEMIEIRGMEMTEITAENILMVKPKLT